MEFSRPEYWSEFPFPSPGDLHEPETEAKSYVSCVGRSVTNRFNIEVTNRLKGLDLIDRVPEELWTQVHDIVQETVIKTLSKGKKMQKGKMVV